jgi:hypothetical protein
VTDGIFQLPVEPAGANVTFVQLRLEPEMVTVIDRWRSQQPDRLSRTAAVDMLMRLGLAGEMLGMRRRNLKLGNP